MNLGSQIRDRVIIGAGQILLTLLVVIASESWSAEPQSAKDFFPRQGFLKTYRCTSGWGPSVRQTYRERDRFRGEEATALVEDQTTPDGEREHSVHYYRVLDDRWSLLGSEKLSRSATVIFEPAITQFRFPLKTGDRWRQDYTERTVLPSRDERRVRCATAFVVQGRETITIAGKKYDCWKVAYEMTRDGKKSASAVSWIAKRYGTVRKAATFSNGKVVVHEMETFRIGGADDGPPKSPGPGRTVSRPRHIAGL